MTFDALIDLIEEKISPFSLNESGKSTVANLMRRYSPDLLEECVDIGIAQYLTYDSAGTPTRESVEKFINKIGGIAYNKSRTPIQQEIQHIKSVAKSIYPYWNDSAGRDTLDDYVTALKNVGWTEEAIVKDLQEDVMRLTNRAMNWSQWFDGMRKWISDIKQWKNDDPERIEQAGTIIPDVITNDLPKYIQSLIQQINASYENKLFDCCAVIMRRLLEVLLVLSYQNQEIESDIMDKSGDRHITLDKMIKNAEQNSKLALSSSTKKGMMIFKDLGNYSAHKIWYNCTKQDIEPHVFEYRAIIEELIYKAGLK